MHAALLLMTLCPAQPPADPAIPNLIIKPDAFQTLVNPNCSHCIDESKRRAAELRPGDRVLCWTRGKYNGGAIPVRFLLNPFRVISDTYGTFVYDPDAGYARAFRASLDYPKAPVASVDPTDSTEGRGGRMYTGTFDEVEDEDDI